VKVIFLQDVPNIAKAGEIKEVANGYGRNFLIPRKLALPAKSQDITAIETQIKTRAHISAETETELVELASHLDGKEIILKARVGAKDRLYGSITSADIAAELESATGSAVDKRKIELANPIRQLGSHEVPIRLAKDIVPKITVTVIDEDQ